MKILLFVISAFCFLQVNIAYAVNKKKKCQSTFSPKAKKHSSKELAIITKTNEFKEAPIYKFIETGNIEKIEELLKSGADTETRDKEGYTPLHLSVLYKEPKAILELIKFNADLSARDINGNTPLHIAAEYNQSDIIEIISSNNKSLLSMKNYNGDTPLHFAIFSHSLDAFRVLIKSQDIAAFNTRDKYGKTLFHNAIIAIGLHFKKWPIDSSITISAVTIAHDLFQMGVDINSKDHNGNTPLHYLNSYISNDLSLYYKYHESAQKQIKVIKSFFIKVGANPVLLNYDGKIPSQVKSSDLMTNVKELNRYRFR